LRTIARTDRHGNSEHKTMTTPRLATILCVILLGALAPVSADAKSSSKNPVTIEVALAPVFGGTPLATGKATHIDRGKQDSFTVEVHNLPMGIYYLTVGGAKVGDIEVYSDGVETHGMIEFDTKKQFGKQKLYFNPLGKQIEIRTVFGTVMGGELPASLPSPDPVYSDYADNVVGQATATAGKRPRGSLKIRSNDAYAWMHFELQRLSAGAHTLTANDVPIANFTPLSGGFARLEFETDPSGDDYPLNFDPAGVTYRVIRGDSVVLTFTTDPGTIGGGLEPVRLITTTLAPTGEEPGAEGDAALNAKGSNLDLEVHIGSLSPGPYSLRIAGSSQGTIHIHIGSDPFAIFDLSNYRSGIGVLPLTVDPRGKLMEIVDDTNAVVLTRTFPN